MDIDSLTQLTKKLREVGLNLKDVYDVTPDGIGIQLVHETKQIAGHWLERCVNLFGKEREFLRKDRPRELGWFLTVKDQNIYLALFNHERARWKEEQLGALVWLMNIGLSPELQEHSSYFPHPDRELLLQNYPMSRDAQQAYTKWLSGNVANKLEAATSNCNPELYKRRLCCPTHMMLLAQQLTFYEWLSFLSIEHPPEPTKVTNSSSPAPGKRELLIELKEYLQPHESINSFLRAHFDFTRYTVNRGLQAPLTNCSPARYETLLCCPAHLAVQAVEAVHHEWAVMLDDSYGISKIPHYRGFTPNILSQTWVELLIHTQNVNMSGLNFPPHYTTPTNIENYYLPSK